MHAALRLSTITIAFFAAIAVAFMGSGVYSTVRLKHLCNDIDKGLDAEALKSRVEHGGYRWNEPLLLSPMKPGLYMTSIHAVYPCTCLIELRGGQVTGRTLKCL